MNGEKINQYEVGPSTEIKPQIIQTLRTFDVGMFVHGADDSIINVSTESGWNFPKSAKHVKEEILAHGHPNVNATHTTTFEITKHTELTEDGDCIIGVAANKACKDLSSEFKNALKEAKKVEMTIEAGGVSDKVVAYGSPALKLTHPEDIVVRKSNFIDSRTLAILADKSANELKQDLVEKLRNPNTQIKIILEIK